MWQIYLNYHQRMRILPGKKRINRDKCSFATKQRMFGVFAIDEILRYRGTRFPSSHTLCHPAPECVEWGRLMIKTYARTINVNVVDVNTWVFFVIFMTIGQWSFWSTGTSKLWETITAQSTAQWMSGLTMTKLFTFIANVSPKKE